MAVLAGVDFFTVEVLTWRGLVTCYIFFFIHWRVAVSAGPESPGIRPGMDAADGAQRDRRDGGFLDRRRYALHDRDTKFCSVFRATPAARGIKPDSTPGAESKPEFVRRKMGAIGERGMLIETNLVRRSLAANAHL
jgi:hypothetical protein